MVVVCVATVFAGWQLIRTPVVIGTPRGLLWWFRMEDRVRHARWERVSWMQWSSDGIVPLLKIRMRASDGSNDEVGDRNLELTAPAPFTAQLAVRQISGWWYARSLLPRVDGEGPLLLLRPDRMRRLQSRIRAIETDRRVRR
jgi:hypothetical protein